MNEPVPPPPARVPEAPYIERRLESQRLWHSQKATWNKRWFYATEITTLLAGALIPIVNVWTTDDPYIARVLSAVLGGIIVVAAGVAKLFKFQENWLQYRAIAETLGREREFYAGKVGDYAIAEAQREARLVDRVEGLLASTTAQFLTTHRATRGGGQAPEEPGK